MTNRPSARELEALHIAEGTEPLPRTSPADLAAQSRVREYGWVDNDGKLTHAGRRALHRTA